MDMIGAPMRDSFLVFGAPDIREDEIEEIVACLRSGWIGTGPRVAAFEQAFCSFKGGGGFPVAVSSCTSALHLSMIAADLQPGDEVITTALTFCSTVNAIIHAGCTPVLADVEPDTMNISPLAIAECITPRTRAILPVHFAGRPCNMDAICGIAKQHGLRIVEDCAHAIESTYGGRHVGTIGDFGCFSFYVTKNVATGEGGLVLCRREEDANRIKTLALHGMSKDAWKRFNDEGYKHYRVVECGFKYNMMDLQAAMGIHQLRRIEQSWRRRRDVWNQYSEYLKDLPLSLPLRHDPSTRHAYHLYCVLIHPDARLTRDQFLNRMTQCNIGVGVHYESIAQHPFYQQSFGWRPDKWPIAADIGNRTVSLPLSPKLTDQDVKDVADAVRSCFA